MSNPQWQPYVQELMKNGSMQYAAICGVNDGLPWATSDGFSVIFQ